MLTAQAEQEKLLTPADAAHVLDCHPSAVVRWMTKGTLLRDGTRLRLQCVRLPGSFRTSKAWLDSFLAAIAHDRTGNAKAAPKGPTKSSRVGRMRAGLAAAGFKSPGGKNKSGQHGHAVEDGA